MSPKIFSSAAIAVLVIAGLVFAGVALSSSTVSTVSDSAFSNHKRPKVAFDHSAHEALADCNACHHLYEDGVLSDYDSAGTECSECHEVGQGPVPLVIAYHRQCKGCHEDEKAGPVTCAQCHNVPR
jgi:hypothetical protein